MATPAPSISAPIANARPTFRPVNGSVLELLALVVGVALLVELTLVLLVGDAVVLELEVLALGAGAGLDVGVDVGLDVGLDGLVVLELW